MNSNKGMVVAFCRMNPPTKGHLILVNKMRYIADRKGYDTGLFLSHSNDSKKNPLPYEEKITFVDEAFGDIVDVIMSKANSIYDVLKQVYENGFNNVCVVCGSDRINEFERIKKYNGVPDMDGEILYDFDKLEIINAGERDENSEDVGVRASATSMRKAACDGDFKEFCAMSALKNKESNANLFDEIRRMMGCESLKETRMNTHQTHFEDLVCYGSEGLDELNDKIRKFIKDKDEGTHELNKTTKIDGAPALIMWHRFEGYPDDSICLKSFISSANNVLSSASEIREKYEGRDDMIDVLTKGLALARSIPSGEAWQGDCLFSRGKKEETINGKDYLTFQPNKIIYCLPKGSDTYYLAKDSDFGIAFHTIYKGNLENKVQSFNVDTSRLQNVPDGYFLMSVNLDEGKVDTEQIKKDFKTLLELEGTLYNNEKYDSLCQNESFMSFWAKFENIQVADNGKNYLDVNTFIEDLENYITDESEKNLNSRLSKLKTDKGRDKASASSKAELKELIDLINNNIEVIINFVKCLNKAIDIKLYIWKNLKTKTSYDTFYMSKTNGYIPANMEGISISDQFGNIVKIVDRSEFSKNNRSDDILSGFDHGNGLSESVSVGSLFESILREGGNTDNAKTLEFLLANLFDPSCKIPSGKELVHDEQLENFKKHCYNYLEIDKDSKFGIKPENTLHSSEDIADIFRQASKKIKGSENVSSTPKTDVLVYKKPKKDMSQDFNPIGNRKIKISVKSGAARLTSGDILGESSIFFYLIAKNILEGGYKKIYQDVDSRNEDAKYLIRILLSLGKRRAIGDLLDEYKGTVKQEDVWSELQSGFEENLEISKDVFIDKNDLFKDNNDFAKAIGKLKESKSDDEDDDDYDDLNDEDAESKKNYMKGMKWYYFFNSSQSKKILSFDSAKQAATFIYDAESGLKSACDDYFGGKKSMIGRIVKILTLFDVKLKDKNIKSFKDFKEYLNDRDAVIKDMSKNSDIDDLKAVSQVNATKSDMATEGKSILRVEDMSDNLLKIFAREFSTGFSKFKNRSDSIANAMFTGTMKGDKYYIQSYTIEEDKEAKNYTDSIEDYLINGKYLDRNSFGFAVKGHTGVINDVSYNISTKGKTLKNRDIKAFDEE